MVKVSMKVLISIAVVLHFFRLLVAILITCFPQFAFKVAGMPLRVPERVIPVTTFLSLLTSLLWLIVVAIIVLVSKKVTIAGKVIIAIAFGLSCLTNIVLSYGNLFENAIWGRYGEYRLMALSVINSAISMLTSPLGIIVSALFTLVVGGYLWQKADKS